MQVEGWLRFPNSPLWFLVVLCGLYLFTMMAVGLFNFLISADFSHWPARAGKVIAWLSGISFGVYLIHSYVISVFTDILDFNFNKLQMNVYLCNLLNIFLVILLSTMITLLLKKIPKLKAVIGE